MRIRGENEPAGAGREVQIWDEVEPTWTSLELETEPGEEITMEGIARAVDRHNGVEDEENPEVTQWPIVGEVEGDGWRIAFHRSDRGHRAITILHPE